MIKIEITDTLLDHLADKYRKLQERGMFCTFEEYVENYLVQNNFRTSNSIRMNRRGKVLARV